MPTAYVIANVTVTNPVQCEGYKVWSSAAMQAHGDRRRHLSLACLEFIFLF